MVNLMMSTRITKHGLRFIRYLDRVSISFSVLLNVILGGPSNQTFSARNYEWRKSGYWNIVWVLDTIFFFDPDHCLNDWLYWKTSRDLRKYSEKNDVGGFKPQDIALYYDYEREKETRNAKSHFN